MNNQRNHWFFKGEKNCPCTNCLRRRKQNVEHEARRARNLRPLASSRTWRMARDKERDGAKSRRESARAR